MITSPVSQRTCQTAQSLEECTLALGLDLLLQFKAYSAEYEMVDVDRLHEGRQQSSLQP